jgi:hypothetical protein
MLRLRKLLAFISVACFKTSLLGQVNYYGWLKLTLVLPTLSMKPTHRSVNTNKTNFVHILRVYVANVWWLGTSGGVLVVRTDKYSYGDTCLLISLLQLLYGKLALRLNNVAVDAECLGDLRFVIVVVIVAIGMSQ